MNKLSVTCIFLLLTSASLNLAITQGGSISTTDTFAIPALNSQISFATEVNYTSADLQGSTWYFTGLHADGKGGYPINGHLHISAENCNVSINYLQSWSQPEIGSVGLQWIKYSVVGVGTQTLDANDLFPNSNRWTEWTVMINGNISQMGESWNYTDNKQLVIHTGKVSSNVQINVQHTAESSDTAPLPPPAPANVNFTSKDYFSIPSTGAAINFAVDGSYDQADLNNDTWEFTNLTLSSYAINAGNFASNVTGRNVLPYILQAGYPANLGVSAQGCNLTITGVTPLTWHSYEPGINYTVQGIGSQLFTFPFEIGKFNWSITIDGMQKENGDGWFIINDHQLRIDNASKQVQIDAVVLPSHWVPVVPFSFYLPVVLSIVIIGTALTIGTAAFILQKRRKKQQ